MSSPNSHRLTDELGYHRDAGVGFLHLPKDDYGAVGEELEGAAGGRFIDAADFGDGDGGDWFGGVAEGGDDILFLGGEPGKEANGKAE